MFNKACNLIGLLEEDKKDWENFNKPLFDANFLDQKIMDRNKARKKGDYKLADMIRKELEVKGITIEDKGDQTTWKYK